MNYVLSAIRDANFYTLLRSREEDSKDMRIESKMDI